jgi:hypothetical protein
LLKNLETSCQGSKKEQEVFHSCVEENFQSLFLFYKATAGTASSKQEAMIENALKMKFHLMKTTLGESAIHYQAIFSKYDRYFTFPMLSSNADVFFY